MAREALVEWLKSQNEYDEYIMDHCKDENKAVSAVMKVQKELMYHVPEAMSDIWKLCEVPVECLNISGDSSEFLLGNDLLLKLGIDVKRQLDLLA
ncbi:hypothetical protein F441_19495, partial [Phytophthora nicotianae CJ01A1]